MKKQYFLLLFLLLSVGIHAQKTATGYVLDNESHVALEGVKIQQEGEKNMALTNKNGEFAITVAKGRRQLFFSKEEYTPQKYNLKPGFQQRPLRIYLESIYVPIKQIKKRKKIDSLFLTHKNAISLSILEFLQVGIGLRYERFLFPKHSLGLHATYYIYGISSTVYADIGGYELNPKYKGFKMAPFYRYYILRKNAKGLFLDAKIPFGYFNFSNLEYRYSYSYDSHRYKYIDHSFWTYGGGVSIGFMSRLPKRNHGFVNISFGYQYFPMAKPPEYLYEETSHGHIYKYETDVEWWDQTGPGAKFEFKLTLGGVF